MEVQSLGVYKNPFPLMNHDFKIEKKKDQGDTWCFSSKMKLLLLTKLEACSSTVKFFFFFKKKKNTCNFQTEGISSKHLFGIAFSGHGIIFRNCYKTRFTS